MERAVQAEQADLLEHLALQVQTEQVDLQDLVEHQVSTEQVDPLDHLVLQDLADLQV